MTMVPYASTNTSVADFVVVVEDNHVSLVSGLKQESGAYFYSERVGRKYVKKEANMDSVGNIIERTEL